MKITHNGISSSGLRVLTGGIRVEVFVAKDDPRPETIVLLCRLIYPDGTASNIIEEAIPLTDPIWNGVNVLNDEGVLHPMSRRQKARIANRFISHVASDVTRQVNKRKPE